MKRIGYTRLLVLCTIVVNLVACRASTYRSDPVSLGRTTTVCFDTVSVRTGKHEIAAFNSASVRAVKSVLAERGYELSCDTAVRYNLTYSMVFNAQSLTWDALMSVSDVQDKLLYTARASDTIEPAGAFQYTTEKTAERLLKHFLDG